MYWCTREYIYCSTTAQAAKDLETTPKMSNPARGLPCLTHTLTSTSANHIKGFLQPRASAACGTSTGLTMTSELWDPQPQGPASCHQDPRHPCCKTSSGSRCFSCREEEKQESKKRGGNPYDGGCIKVTYLGTLPAVGRD